MRAGRCRTTARRAAVPQPAFLTKWAFSLAVLTLSSVLFVGVVPVGLVAMVTLASCRIC